MRQPLGVQAAEIIVHDENGLEAIAMSSIATVAADSQFPVGGRAYDWRAVEQAREFGRWFSNHDGAGSGQDAISQPAQRTDRPPRDALSPLPESAASMYRTESVLTSWVRPGTEKAMVRATIGVNGKTDAGTPPPNGPGAEPSRFVLVKAAAELRERLAPRRSPAGDVPELRNFCCVVSETDVEVYIRDKSLPDVALQRALGSIARYLEAEGMHLSRTMLNGRIWGGTFETTAGHPQAGFPVSNEDDSNGR